MWYIDAMGYFVRRLALILGAGVMATFATACGGGDDDAADPTPAAIASAPAGQATVAPSGGECDADSPPNLASTSHRPNIATTENVIRMSWTAPASAPESYRFAFSQNPQEPPDQMETAEGDATSAMSDPLGQNRWYFYLQEVNAGTANDPVRCGPYVIERDANGGSGGGSGIADPVTVTIAASGGSSVEYFNNQNERLFCGDTSISGHDVTCSAEFARGSQLRIQRTLGLSDQEEARWRLSAWGGACDFLDADAEPRGGQCILTLADDASVTVAFEQRPSITISHSGPPLLFLRWGLDYRPAAQKGGGNPLTVRGTFDCDTDTLIACGKQAYFDAGTTVIITAGTGVDAPNFASWGGACSGTQSTCELLLEADSEVSFNWKY